MARTKREPSLDWAVTVRLPHELESRVKDLASERLVPPAVALRQLVKERLDELQQVDDAWLYTPERLARQEAARASARAGRTVALSRDDLRRLQALDDDALDAEIDRLRIRAEQAGPKSLQDA
jgi:predicted DNA-binding protein